ncbi:MAG: hypothetical protein E7143_02355 [Rikenellaceae bacterium]|nr:hypothetical protein [Rikenellaceae bacterium]
MGLFSPPKRRPNQFNYIPRYYDPEKERREARRRELRGESSSDDTPYTPGKYIRTVREARAERKSQQKQSNGTPRAILVFGIAIAVIVIYMLVPRIVNIITMAGKQTNPEVRQAELESETFNPYTPITIVPNDYTEE